MRVALNDSASALSALEPTAPIDSTHLEPGAPGSPGVQQYFPAYGDVSGLDGNDQDGLACESLP
ncbi:hypothetical protein [Modestobacter sp. DSM 44400]|uniref:hypothetical protein n=1 Tax=Modestobacter sp. DSM 44400 TaxID=1550230 RepID=UPI0015874EC5|nr:hypothetical protein [Modestobacter sp. DSM 44400]